MSHPPPDLLTMNPCHSSVLKLVQKVSAGSSDLSPYSSHAYGLAGEVYEVYRNKLFIPEEAKELLYILSQPHIRALFDVHDRVANQEYLPSLPDILPQLDDSDIAVKVVKLVKLDEPLGLTLKKREPGGIIYVARVFVGGPADRSGLIEAGDEIHEVNGIPVKGRQIEQVVQILNSSEGTITLKLVPVPINHEPIITTIKMRVFFSYDPSTDLLIPCKDAGLPFKTGDILKIVNTEDPIWWQAKLYYDRNNRTGLIPSRALQVRRMNEIYATSSLRSFTIHSPSLHRKMAATLHSSQTATLAGGLLSPRVQRRASKARRHAFMATIKDGEDVMDYQPPVYEEVELHKAPISYPRPIVIIGSQGVGKQDLVSKLLKENPNMKQPIPVTTRTKKLLETDGKEYRFITRSEMDKLLSQNRLIEHGDYKGNTYAITLESVEQLIQAGKIPVLLCQARSLEIVRTPVLKPFIILIKPPSLEHLKTCKNYSGERSARKLSMHEIEELVLSSARIESCYGSVADMVITNTDFSFTYKHLLAACQKALTEELWVPADWCK